MKPFLRSLIATSKTNNWLVGATVLLVAVLTLQAASSFITGFHLSVSENPSVSKLVPFSAPIQDVAADHFFGVDSSSQLPDTALQLTLVGIFNADVSEHAHVLIAVVGNRAQRYGVGSRLPGGAVIQAIDNTGVTLQNGGRQERLPLLRPKPTFSKESPNASYPKLF